LKKLVVAFDEFTKKNLDIVKLVPSKFERHTDALFLADDIEAGPVEGLREISHIHGTSDHSVHVTLSPVDSEFYSFDAMVGNIADLDDRQESH
jgi:hypothetical protein